MRTPDLNMRVPDLKPGDQVRVTRQSRLPGFRPGDRGEVRVGPEMVAEDGRRFYFVAFKEVRGRPAAVFVEDEIEPDM